MRSFKDGILLARRGNRDAEIAGLRLGTGNAPNRALARGLYFRLTETLLVDGADGVRT